jgi:hypothetical protein
MTANERARTDPARPPSPRPAHSFRRGSKGEGGSSAIADAQRIHPCSWRRSVDAPRPRKRRPHPPRPTCGLLALLFRSERGWLASFVDDCSYSICGFVGVFVLPYSDAYPTGFGETPISVAVPGSVGGDLVCPEGGVGVCDGVVLGTAVPEAAVEEDSDAGRREHHVGGASEVAQWPSRDPVAQTSRMGGRAQGALGLRIAPSVGLHTRPRTRGGRP